MEPEELNSNAGIPFSLYNNRGRVSPFFYFKDAVATLLRYS